MKLLVFLQQTAIEEKLKNAPDGGYQIGVLIGSLIPFIILVGLAYWMYYAAKKRNKNL
ncbi:hypothetical protein [Flavobacterium sp. UBA6135]|jgi:hypothetical protein|uniref:hypothetical protein n=1 Tax=Flavobacterium sp. UBA6135 TaxID=1946553 RepID=UPI0025C659AE|nr:hypothetical protein [Flavobacterium sp. UBA6135]